MRINTNGETVKTVIGVVQKRGPGSERVFGSAAHEAVERCKGLGVPDFVRTVEMHLPQIVLISDDSVLQVCCEARFNVVQQRTGHHELFIHESLAKEFIDFLELREYLIVDPAFAIPLRKFWS